MGSIGGDLGRHSVKLPEGEDVNEWVAVNIVDFFNQLSRIYGAISTSCTAESCPKMTAGPVYEFLWRDEKMKKPISVPAPEYAEYMLDWIQSKLEDESVFPTAISEPFPKRFMKEVSYICKRMFRLYAHIYYHHFSDMQELGSEAHLNTSFKHFFYFMLEFKILDDREMAPLQSLTSQFLGTENDAKPGVMKRLQSTFKSQFG